MQIVFLENVFLVNPFITYTKPARNKIKILFSSCIPFLNKLLYFLIPLLGSSYFVFILLDLLLRPTPSLNDPAMVGMQPLSRTQKSVGFFPIFSLRSIFAMIDRDNHCWPVTVYNMAVGAGFAVGDSVAIPEPFCQETDFVEDGQV